MTQVTVYEPVPPADQTARSDYATRGRLPDGLRVTLVENSKARARELLEFVAEELRERLPIVEVDVYSKDYAGRPLDGDEAKRIAARSHLVITGVGD